MEKYCKLYVKQNIMAHLNLAMKPADTIKN